MIKTVKTIRLILLIAIVFILSLSLVSCRTIYHIHIFEENQYGVEEERIYIASKVIKATKSEVRFIDNNGNEQVLYVKASRIEIKKIKQD